MKNTSQLLVNSGSNIASLQGVRSPRRAGASLSVSNITIPKHSVYNLETHQEHIPEGSELSVEQELKRLERNTIKVEYPYNGHNVSNTSMQLMLARNSSSQKVSPFYNNPKYFDSRFDAG